MKLLIYVIAQQSSLDVWTEFIGDSGAREYAAISIVLEKFADCDKTPSTLS